MSYFIPDSRWEEPNLLIPGSKPIGNVEHNGEWPSLIRFWINQFGKDLPALQPNKVMRDVVSGATAYNFYNFAGREYVSVINNGKPYIEGSAISRITVDSPLVFADSDPFTLIFRTYAPSSELKLSAFGVGLGNGMIWNRRGSYVRFYSAAGAQTIGSGGFTANAGEVTTAIASNGGGTGSATLTAYQIETNESKTSSSHTTGCTISSLAEYQQNDANNYEFFAIFNAELSSGAIHDFVRGLYSNSLIPK